MPGDPSVHPGGHSSCSPNIGANPGDLWILPLVEGPDKTWRAGTPRLFVNTPEFEAPRGLLARRKTRRLHVERAGSLRDSCQTVRRRRRPVAGVDERRRAPGLVEDYAANCSSRSTTRSWRCSTASTARPSATTRRGPGRPSATRPRARRGSTTSIPTDKRAIVATPDTTGATTYDKVAFVFNFFDELRRLLPPEVGSMSPQQFACRDRSAHWPQRCR